MKKLIIVDYNGMAYKYVFGAKINLSIVKDGKTINTTIPNFTIKEMVKLSNNGVHDLAVVRDLTQSHKRTKIMKEVFELQYKEGRKKGPPILYEGMDLTFELLTEAGISTYASEGIEADDIIASLVKLYKKDYDLIEIYTGDKDMLPLVQPGVKVFYRRPKMYLPINEVNYEQAVQNIGKFKEYLVPYNSVGMYLWLKGDKEDNIPGLGGLGNKAYNKTIQALYKNGFDFGRANLEIENKEYILDSVVPLLAPSGEQRDYMKFYLTNSWELVSPQYVNCVKPQSYEWSKVAQVVENYRITLPFYK